MPKIISWSKAKERGLKKYYTGKKCRRGHKTYRYVAQRVCIKCNSETSPKYKTRYRLTKKSKLVEKKYRLKWKKLFKSKKIINVINQKYHKKKYKNDPVYRIKHILRGYLTGYIKKTNNKKKHSFAKVIGCSPEFLKKYLEKKFKPGMNWKNQGFKGWHIDHIKPISKAKSIKEIEKLFHYTNLQPLWAKDNLKKSNKY